MPPRLSNPLSPFPGPVEGMAFSKRLAGPSNPVGLRFMGLHTSRQAKCAGVKITGTRSTDVGKPLCSLKRPSGCPEHQNLAISPPDSSAPPKACFTGSTKGTGAGELAFLPPQIRGSGSFLTPACRGLCTVPAASRRIWLAKAPRTPSFWRQALGWGCQRSTGSVWEVLMPPKTTSEVSSLALGGCGVFVVSGGRLLGAGLSSKGPEGGALGSLELKEIEAVPLEEAGVAREGLNPLGRFSKTLGTPHFEGRANACPLLQKHNDASEGPQFVKVAAGLYHCAAITNQGLLYTWGRGGTWGAGSPLGHGDTRDRSKPTPVAQVSLLLERQLLLFARSHKASCFSCQRTSYFPSSGRWSLYVSFSLQPQRNLWSTLRAELLAPASLRVGLFLVWTFHFSAGLLTSWGTSAVSFGLTIAVPTKST